MILGSAFFYFHDTFRPLTNFVYDLSMSLLCLPLAICYMPQVSFCHMPYAFMHPLAICHTLYTSLLPHAICFTHPFCYMLCTLCVSHYMLHTLCAPCYILHASCIPYTTHYVPCVAHLSITCYMFSCALSQLHVVSFYIYSLFHNFMFHYTIYIYIYRQINAFMHS